MAQNIEQIRQQLKSVDLSFKITKAMQLVATAKLKKMAKRIEKIKPYYTEVYDSFHQFLPRLENSLFITNKKNDYKKTLWVVFSSNLGLCGGFNTNLNKLILKNLKPEDKIITIGSKATTFFTNQNRTIIKSYNHFTPEFRYEDTQDLTVTLISLFSSNAVSAIKIAYTKYHSSVTLVPTVVDLLPIVKLPEKNTLVLTDFEPDAKTVVETAIPLYIGAMVYGTLAESQVSEQAARRLAMENASNNANEIKNKLLISYNRARQSIITQEIAEIIGGVNAQNEDK